MIRLSVDEINAVIDMVCREEKAKGFVSDGEECLDAQIGDSVAKAQLKKIVNELDIKFLLSLLKQSEDVIWSKKGQLTGREQIKKLKALVKEA